MSKITSIPTLPNSGRTPETPTVHAPSPSSRAVGVPSSRVASMQHISAGTSRIVERVRAGLIARTEEDLARERGHALEIAEQVQFFRVHQPNNALHDSYARKLEECRARIAKLEADLEGIKTAGVVHE